MKQLCEAINDLCFNIISLCSVICKCNIALHKMNVIVSENLKSNSNSGCKNNLTVESSMCELGFKSQQNWLHWMLILGYRLRSKHACCSQCYSGHLCHIFSSRWVVTWSYWWKDKSQWVWCALFICLLSFLATKRSLFIGSFIPGTLTQSCWIDSQNFDAGYWRYENQVPAACHR